MRSPGRRADDATVADVLEAAAQAQFQLADFLHEYVADITGEETDVVGEYWKAVEGRS